MCFRFSRLTHVINRPIRRMAKRFKTDKTMPNETNCSESVHVSSINVTTSTNGFIRLAPPTKSQSDVKEYSVIKLKNGLTALLISDKSQILPVSLVETISSDDSSESGSESSFDGEEDNEVNCEDEILFKNTKNNEEKLAACALCIGVGSFSDPESIPGLAHFLEHMIFMGSEKYPTENEFDVFIKKKGGSDNAFTECDHTTFYFDCHETHLRGAMDIFSELFISPLMKRDTMTKEREAIESEFQLSLSSDGSRKSQLLCSLADKSNPVNKFMWGNLITLRDNVKDDDLYKAVHEFRERHYSAHRMTLAVQARLPIETLESWVLECFENVPNNGLPKDEFTVSLPPFRMEEFCKLYIVQPVKEIDHIDLTWVMPSTLNMYKTKPLSYLSWVIGHEGKGSLLSYLRNNLWSFGVTVSAGGDGTEDNCIFTLFTISLVLTQEGMQHIEEILNLVFDYIKMFQTKGPQERIFKEMQLVADTTFRFAEEVSSSDNVEDLAENMHFYPSTDIITGPELYFEYDEHLITSFLNELKPDNANIMISSKSLASNETLDKVEPWFGTKYTSKEIPPEWIQNWHDIKENKRFHLPEPNPFIASNFTLLPSLNNPEEYPTAIMKDDIIELWYKQDTTFKLPHAFCCLQLVSSLSHKSAKNTAMLDLFISILKQSLIEELYPANVAQLDYNFHTGEKGIVITVNGFNEKLKILLQVIVDGMVSLSQVLRPDMVSAMTNELKRGYSNANLKTNFLAREIRMSILLETYWTAVDKEKALQDVTYEELQSFTSQYFKNLLIQCLIQGNISNVEAIEIGDMVKTRLSCKPLLDNAPEIRVNQLPFGERYCVVSSFNSFDTNSLVTNYYQSGLGSIKEYCVIELLLMMMEEPIFDSLRTQQQLGYDVSCSIRDTFGILGFSISVHCQSDRNSVDFVESRITQFLEDFLATLTKTSQDDFIEIQESLIKLKKCADVHLKEEVKRNWDEIKSGEYLFDRLKKEREYIEKLTLEEVITWFKNNSGIEDPSKCKKLSTQIVGNVKGSQNNETDDSPKQNKHNDNVITEWRFLPQDVSNKSKFIFNTLGFNKSLTLYPPHKIT